MQDEELSKDEEELESEDIENEDEPIQDEDDDEEMAPKVMDGDKVSEAGEDVLSVEQFLGTLMQSSVEIWKEHLLTDDYNKHIVLNDFYEGIVDLTDSLIEGWMSIHGRPRGFENVLIVSNNDVDTYFKQLAIMVRKGSDKFLEESELKSDADDILKLIGSTVYKLNELIRESRSWEIPSFDKYVKMNM